MYTITKDNLGDGHEAVVRLVLQGRDFNDVLTEDKEQTLEYPEPVNIHINTPFANPMASPKLTFGEKSLNKYVDEILHIRPLVDRPGLPDFSYLYSNLIWDFPWGEPFKVFDEKGRFMRIDWPHGNGRGDGINQVDYVVNKLTSSPSSRRAVINLYEPRGHPQMDDPPCLNHINFLLRNGELNMHALFRSNDMLSAWGANAYALAHFQNEVRNRINEKEAWSIQMGWLETTSISAHIYFERDHKEASAFKGFY